MLFHTANIFFLIAINPESFTEKKKKPTKSTKTKLMVPTSNVWDGITQKKLYTYITLQYDDDFRQAVCSSVYKIQMRALTLQYIYIYDWCLFCQIEIPFDLLHNLHFLNFNF